MSVRHRVVAGAPERSSSDAANVILDIVAKTLAPASALDTGAVAHELAEARSAVRMLIAGEHLRPSPLVLNAEPLRLEVSVVTGDAAIALEEQAGKVPGAASATAWTLHLPAPAPITGWVTESLKDLEHVTTEPAPAQVTEVDAPRIGAADIDPDALRRVAGES